MEKLIILDTNSLLYRFYYALPFFSSHQGLPTNALYGLTNALIRIINEEQPDYFIACFDSKVKTFRHQKDIQYKAQRPKASEDLKIQINLAKKILTAFNVSILEKESYEADDLIGSLVKKYPEKFKVIFSGDLDLLQILDKSTILKFFIKGISKIEVYDEKKVIEKFNLLPQQLPDFKALVGDPSDNVIGIKGIGKKTASDLLNKFNNLENIIKAAEKKLIPLPLRNEILINKEKLNLNKELTTIITDLDLNFELKKYPGLNIDSIIEALKEFDFYSIIERLKKNQISSQKLEEIKFNNNLPLFLDKIFCLIENEKIYFYDNKNFYVFPIELQIFEKILSANEIIIFDSKLFIKRYYQLKKEFIEPQKIFDLKIAFWLTKGIIKPTIDKIINFYTNKFSSQNDVKLFLSLMPKIYEDLNRLINDYQLRNVLALDQEVNLILALMELEGLKIDEEKLKVLKENLTQELNQLIEELYQLAGTKFNPNSSNELRDIIFNKLKIPLKKFKKTPKGAISVRETELVKVKDLHPFIEKYLIYRQNSKLLLGFINNLSKYSRQGVIFTNFEITGTATGRIISFSPNLQNLPPKAKMIFIPHKNNIFVSYDYSHIELRILAHFSQDESLISIFNQDLDIHTITAKLLFKKEDEQTRRLAKIINYGIVYGISPQALSEKTGLSLSTSKQLIQDYFKSFPGVKKFINELVDKFQAMGYAETLLGRKRFAFEINSSRALRIAINTPIQGTAADILKLSMIDIFKYLNKQNLLKEIKLKLAIHDELIFEMPENHLKNTAIKIKQIMENVIKLNIPLKVKIKKGYNLNELK